MRHVLAVLITFLSYGSHAAPPLYRIELSPPTDVPCSYLLGSFHIASARDLNGRILVQLVHSDRIVLEMPIERRSQPLTLVPPEFRLEDITLVDLLPPDSWDFVQQKLIPHPIRDAETLSRLHPAKVVDLLWARLELEASEGFLDKELLDVAQQRGIEPTYLETEQIVLEGLRRNLVEELSIDPLETPPIEDCLFLIGIVYKNWASILETLKYEQRKQIGAYLAGDITNFIPPAECQGEDRFIFVERNQLWLPQLTGEIGKGNSFIVVGLAHLFRDYGLIHLLRENGIIVTPVTPQEVGH